VYREWYYNIIIMCFLILQKIQFYVYLSTIVICTLENLNKGNGFGIAHLNPLEQYNNPSTKYPSLFKLRNILNVHF